MHDAVRKVTGKARGKLKALLRTTSMYNMREIMNQYKCHVLPVLESITPAVYHASTSCLAPQDDVQRSFLKTWG